MAYESRNSRSYFYRSFRENGRVHKQYIGAGAPGAAAAESLAKAKGEREKERFEMQARMAQLRANARQLSDVDNQLAVHIQALLIAEGFYQHYRGPWRRRCGQFQARRSESR